MTTLDWVWKVFFPFLRRRKPYCNGRIAMTATTTKAIHAPCPLGKERLLGRFCRFMFGHTNDQGAIVPHFYKGPNNYDGKWKIHAIVFFRILLLE
jgi:hypothetical protein